MLAPRGRQRARRLTRTTAVAARRMGEVHPEMRRVGAVKPYGRRAVHAVNVGPTAREGAHEGGERSGGACSASAHGRRYAATVPAKGEPARALAEDELLAARAPPTRKFLVPADHAAGSLAPVRQMLDDIVPAVEALSREFASVDPVHFLAQWTSVRAAMESLKKYQEGGRDFATRRLGAWSNFAGYVVESGDASTSVGGDGGGGTFRGGGGGELKRPKLQKQPALGPHRDR